DDRPQGTRDASLPPDHLPAIGLRDVEPQDELVVLVDLLDTHRVGLVDELTREILEQADRGHPMFFAFNSFWTAPDGCAPLPSQSRTFPSSSSIVDGFVCGLYRPMISMNLPSRGERESATTTRYTGFFFDPTRVNLMRTAKPLPPCLR